MLVDDVLVAEGELPVGVDEIPLGLNSNLYFGGTRVLINDMAASDINLDGCISDIIANGRWVFGEDTDDENLASLVRNIGSYAHLSQLEVMICLEMGLSGLRLLKCTKGSN